MRAHQWVLVVCLAPIFSLAIYLMAAFLNRIYTVCPWQALGFAALFVLAAGGIVASYLLADL